MELQEVKSIQPISVSRALDRCYLNAEVDFESLEGVSRVDAVIFRALENGISGRYKQTRLDQGRCKYSSRLVPMLPAFGVVLVGSLLLTVVTAAVSWQAQPFNPAAVPLAVRSPYLSSWLLQGDGTALNDDWPRFWTGSVCGSIIW